SADLDDIAVNGTEMYMGDGNRITNFNIVRHEGAGIELAMKAKERVTGNEFLPDASGDVVVYHVNSGIANHQATWGTPAAWSVDFSVASGLNGANKVLDDYS